MYVVKRSGEFLVRYVEAFGAELVLRAHDPDRPLQAVAAEPGHDPLTAIIGRICFVHQHV
jgi:hypothetical protein